MLTERGPHVGMCAQVVYSEFLDLVRSGNVRQARIDESLQKVYFSVQPRLEGQQDTSAVASTSGAPAERARRERAGSVPHFFTKRVADPNMIPMLVAAGVEFGAVKVQHLWPSSTNRACLWCRFHHSLRRLPMRAWMPCVQRSSTEDSSGDCLRFTQDEVVCVHVMRWMFLVGQASMAGALGRVVGTTLALWLPLVPLYLFVRHAIQSRTPSRCALRSQAPSHATGCCQADWDVTRGTKTSLLLDFASALQVSWCLPI